MCGIVGYVGDNLAEIVVVDGLKRLEYRGYDSAGLAVPLDGGLKLRRRVGKIVNLEREVLKPGELGMLVERIAAREVDPYTAASTLVARIVQLRTSPLPQFPDS